MAAEGSLPCSRKPVTGPYPEPLEANPYPHATGYLLRSILILFSLCLTTGLRFYFFRFNAFRMSPTCVTCLTQLLSVI